ncbi:MAG: phosphatase PAP2 family protein [Proteobacteria bacterium]|nr:phosphatase PAP2 family protein [Pseudomonadota bacterium]
MLLIDEAITLQLNAFAHKSIIFDNLMVFISMKNLFKGGVIVCLLWWFWFKEDNEKDRSRRIIVTTITASAVSLIIGRIVGFLLPFQSRPLQSTDIQFQIPYGMSTSYLKNWTSFPSDHALLFFTLATGVFLISRKIGLLTFGYVFVVIGFPRIYIGVHYLSDVIFGGLIGILSLLLLLRTGVGERLYTPINSWRERNPAFFYAFFFFVTYQISTLFEDLRHLGTFLYTLTKFAITA